MKERKVQITVVIEETESNNEQQPHAVPIEKQVDSDQGSKLTRFRAYLPLVVSLIGFAHLIVDKFF